MADERQFLKLLMEITDIARANNNSIAIEEINDYFDELDLNETQMEAIYDYLCKGHITIKGYVKNDDKGQDIFAEPTSQPAPESVSMPSDSISMPSTSAHTTSYRKKVRESFSISKEELEAIHEALLLYKTEEIIEKAIHAYLPVVINIAAKYSNRGIHTDELIQEGNLALVMAVNELAGNTDVSDYEKHIRDRIRESMISVINEEIEAEGAMAAAMGKASLVYEATNHLAEEFGRVATLRELSEYTHIPEDEIEEIAKFSGYAIKYSK